MARSNTGFRSRKTPRHPVSTRAPETPAILPRAGIGVRLIALVYDSLLLIALAAVVNTVLIAIATPSQAADTSTLTVLPAGVRYGLLFPATVAIIFAFYGYCWTRSGQTLGMQTWRLEARRVDGNLMTWADSLRRFLSAAAVPALCGLTSWLLRGDQAALGISVAAGLLFNYLWRWLPLASGAQGRCLHDVLSQTDVLRRPAGATPKHRYRFLGLFGDKEN